MLDKDGETPLHKTCRQGSTSMIQTLIDHGANINLVNIHGFTTLDLQKKNHDIRDKVMLTTEYVRTESSKVITLLLQKGADITEVRNYYHLPLCIAYTKGYDESVKLLIKQGANSNDRCHKDGKTSLWSTCKRGFNKKVEILIDNGADVYEIEETGKTLLHVTSTIYLFQLLIAISSDLNNPDYYGRYPLYESMKDCPIAISEEDKKTALISVFESGNTELSRLVVSRGYTNGIANFNETILHNAYRLGLFANVKILLKDGNDINEVSHYDYTPEILADIAGNDDLLKYLIQKGCLIAGNDDLSEYKNSQDYSYGLRTYRNGYTSLFAACQRKYYDIVDILLERGANLNNALYVACQEGYLDTVQFLVQKGADVNSICP
ncbi:unnamed protein product [Mytilus coruscus]|uniref:Uncharacterized protein n=1 Tax=Mytilus coruscus TaxID=42192 RepID=A0A6J8DSN9_MYTCO|nr:unnamed protein product [Mytilus coruscus]